MKESRIGLSRRSVLRYSVLASLPAIAGCLGDDDSDGDDDSEGTPGSGTPDSSDPTPPPDEDLPALFDLAGDGSERFADWLAPEATHPPNEGSETLFAYQNFDVAAEQDVQGILDYRAQEAEVFGVEPDSIRGELIVGTSTEDVPTSSIYLGDFDAESVVSTFEEEGGTVTEEYQGYTVFEDRIAVGDDALIENPGYDRFIDASMGEGPHLSDESEDVGILLDLQPPGLQIAAVRQSDQSDLRMSATSFLSVDENVEPDNVVRSFVFEDADVASVERAEEIAETGRYERTLNSEYHGRVVMLEYEA